LIDLAVAQQTGLRSWFVFMLRRWLRTLPLYWVVLLALGLIWPPMFWVPHNRLLLPDLLAYGTMTQNLLWRMRDGWFSVSWSLAVEEWFYLLFSALLLGLSGVLRRSRAPVAAPVVLTLCVFVLTPPVLRWIVLGGGVWKVSDDHIVPLWFDALAIGVIAAAVLRRFRPRRTAALALLAAGLMLIVFVWNGGLGTIPALDPRLRRTFDYDILAVGFALCLPASLCLRYLPPPASLIVRRLSGWSYCLYLTHLSALEIGGFYAPRFGVSPPVTACGCVAALFVISWFSWRFFEAPLLALRPVQRVPVDR
jgi:peptidoglycan/LPS O-acetylase OafA/YrhL